MVNIVISIPNSDGKTRNIFRRTSHRLYS